MFRIKLDPTLTPQQQVIAGNLAVAQHEARRRSTDAALAAEQKRRKDLENEMSRHEQRWSRETRDKAIAAQKAADETLKRETKAMFLKENPNATERDFERLWPELRDRRLLDRVNEAANRVEVRRRLSDNYRPL